MASLRAAASGFGTMRPCSKVALRRSLIQNRNSELATEDANEHERLVKSFHVFSAKPVSLLYFGALVALNTTF